MSDASDNQRRFNWTQCSLLTLMLSTLVAASFLLPFVRRAQHVRFWKEAWEGSVHDIIEIEIETSTPSQLALSLGVPRLVEFAFPDIATNYFDSVRSIYLEKPQRELQGQIAMHLDGCRDLVHLHWPGEVNSSMARKLRNCEHLSILKLKGCSDTDPVLSNIGGLEHLQVVTLSHCSLSPLGIEKVRRMKWLRLFLMYETEISQESINKLREQLPNCYVLSFTKEDLPK